VFNKFSQLLTIVEGDGIEITTAGTTRTVGVSLEPSSGLVISNGNIDIADSFAGDGLTLTSGVLSVNAASGGVASSVAVKLDGSDNLVVNTSEINTALGGVLSGVTNGLSETDGVVRLGGALDRVTTISGDNTNYLVYQDTAIDANARAGIRYAGDYSQGFVPRSLIDKAYVDSEISGVTLTFNNGITNNSGIVSLGGTLTGNTSISGSFTEIFSIENVACVCFNTSDTVEFYGESAVTLGTINQPSHEGSIFINESCLELRHFNGIGTTSFVLTNTGTTFSDSQNTVSPGIQYDTDYSNNYTNRSLVDKEYVVNQIGNITGTTLNNYLLITDFETYTGTTDTRITNIENDITFITGTTLNNYLLITDFETYTGETATALSAITEITDVALTGATNGLSVSGRDVKLGDSALTEDTTIDAADSYQFNVTGFTSSLLSASGNGVSLTINTSDIELLTNGSVYTFGSAMDITTAGNADITSSGALNLTTTATVLITGSTITNNTNSFAVNASSNIAMDGGSSVSISSVTEIDLTSSIIDVNGTVNISTPTAITSEAFSVLVRDDSTGDIKTVDGSQLGEDNNTYATVTASTSITATTDMYVILVDSSTAVTITLPASPVAGQAYKIKDATGDAIDNIITISGNGKNIDSSATAVINTDYGAIEVVYDDDFDRWFVLSFVN
jgi:hypothetical protein